MAEVQKSDFKVLEAVQQLKGQIAARANEIEVNRALPAELNEKLKAAGAFRMLIPRAYGGPEVHPLEVVRVIEAIAREDASAAWTAMVATGFNVIFGRFSRSLLDKVFAKGPDVLARGAFAPHGIAIPQKGGYMVRGQWPLASGSYKHDWIMGNCLVIEDGKPRMGANGTPDMRVALVPPDKAEFLDTWDAVGLRGSASHDIVIKDVFVEEEFTANMWGPASFDSPIHRLFFPMITAPSHCAVVLGAAQAALDDLGTLAKTKRPAFSTTRLNEDPVFRQNYGHLCARLAAIRSFTDQETEWSWQLANSGRPLSPADLARMTSMSSHVHLEGVNIVNDVFTLAGSTACYVKSPIQRRWRDVRCAAQHAAANMSAYTNLGAALLEAVPG